MKVVIDTNVLVSAVWRGRNPETVILWILAQPNWQWMVSKEIMDEYKEVLHRKKFLLSPESISRWEMLLDRDTRPASEILEIDFPRDQKDAKFLACALSCAADYILTGDGDFDEARKVGDVTIISVSMFKRLFVSG